MTSWTPQPPSRPAETVPPLSPGDRFPNLFLRAQDGSVASTGDRLKGGPALMFWLRDDSDADAVAQLRALMDGALPRVERGAQVIAITRADAEAVAALGAGLDKRLLLLSDADGRGSAAMGVPADRRFTLAWLLDANQHVRAVFDEEDGDPVARGLAALDAALPIPDPVHVPMCAPVLIIPDVLDPDMCRKLIRTYQTKGNEESGTFRMVEGKPVLTPNRAVKRRRDHYINDPALFEEVAGILRRRIVPEVRRAFVFNITRFEELKIARYDGAVGGYFKPHRDNTAPQTVHRRFAMTLNLNEGAYEGGFLRFPEYGNTMYRPGAGSAAVFSCSLLHEATNVTAGERYVLLVFMFDEAGAAMRDEMRQRIAAAQ